MTIAHDVAIAAIPSWLTTFQNTGETLLSDAGTFRLYSADYPAGHVALGGNEGPGASMYTVIISAPAGPDKEAPSVDAGPDQTVTPPATNAPLNGVVTDDGMPSGSLAFSWTQVTGPASLTIADPAAETTTATFGEPGTYVLQLVADDGDRSAADETTIVVDAPEDIASPSIPQGLAAAPLSPDALHLTWDASTDTGGSGIAGYLLRRDGEVVADELPGLEHSDTGLAASTFYTYTVDLRPGAPRVREIAVPDAAAYDVVVLLGDPAVSNRVNDILLEATPCVDPDGEDDFDECVVRIPVVDGHLTIAPEPGAVDAAICSIEVLREPDPTDDVDLDGLRDVWEQEVFGAIGDSTWGADWAIDGNTDGEEWIMGTDPLREDEFRVSLFRDQAGNMTVSFPTLAQLPHP